MQIKKATSSEVFNLYAARMNKRASWFSGITDAMLALFKTNPEKAADDIARALLAVDRTKRMEDLNKLKVADPALHFKVAAKLFQEVLTTAHTNVDEALELSREIFKLAEIIGDPKLAEKYLITKGDLAQTQRNLDKADELRQRYLTAKNNLQKKLDTTILERDALQKHIQDMSALEEAIETMGNTILYQQGTLAEIAGGLKRLSRDVAGIGEGVAEVGRGVTRVEEGIEGASKTLGELSGAVAENKTAIEQVRAAAEALPDDIKTKVSGELMPYIDNLGTMIKGKEDEIAKLTTEVDSLRTALSAGDEAAAARQKELIEQIAKLQKDNAEMAKALKDTNKAISKLKTGKDSGGFLGWLGAARKGTLAYAAARGAWGIVSLAAVAGLIYYGWNYLLKTDSAAVETIKNLETKMTVALERLRAINPNFREGSNGKRINESLIAKLTASIADVPAILSPDTTSLEQAEEILGRLDALDAEVKAYLDGQEAIAADLTNQQGWPEAIAALTELRPALYGVKELAHRAIGIKPPGGQAGTPPSVTPETEKQKRKEIVGALAAIPFIGEEYAWAPAGFSQRNPGFINAVTKWAQTWLLKPKGRAVLMAAKEAAVEQKKNEEILKQDPNATVTVSQVPLIQAGRRTGNIILDTLIKIYKEKGPDAGQGDLKDLIMSGAKGRRGGFRQEKKEQRGGKARRQRRKTRRNIKRQERRASLEFFTQNFEKTANLSTLDDNFVKEDKSLLKMADSFSKSYYQDAVSGLYDQYAKSYYAGLKGMYSEKLSKTEADYDKLYKTDNETGADLVGRAHPKSIVTSESMGRGGLVENLVEQKRHMEGVALSMPSGNYRQKHAWIVNSLVKLANIADNDSLLEASDLIDTALQEIVSISKK